jgi:thiol-disulfide isomerase/thioredoxin
VKGALSGKVVGPDGKPLEGVWVEPGGSYAARSAFTRTDENGRFTVKDLPRGMARLSFSYGKLTAVGTKYFADNRGDAGDELEIQLRPIDEILAESKTKQASRPKPLTVGQIAPEWEVGDWTDGKPRKLADQQGKIVFLDFWGMWCDPCVSQLPVLEKLRKKYEPRGVVFVSIHTAGEKADRIRRFLEFSKSSLVSAVDVGAGSDVNGTTADRYGVRGYPTVVLIDRAGKIAFRSDDRSQFPEIGAIMKELGIDPKTGTEAQSHQLIETIFDREIEALLKRP